MTSEKSHRYANPYAQLTLRKQLYMECRAMAEYAMASGKPVPASAIKNIESYEEYIPDPHDLNEKVIAIRKDVDVTALVETHHLLAKLVEPAIPQTILLLDIEQETPSLLKFLGPVALVRQLMLVAIICLTVFVLLMTTPYVGTEDLTGDILELEGMRQFASLLYYLVAAGLGASFAALYKANEYISKGTYTPSFQASYWIRFTLGIIAGLLLALLISHQSLQTEGLLSNGVVRPLLAILGGFSADLLYTFLNRMVETFKSMFEGGSQNILEAKAQEGKSRLASQEIENRMKLAQNLMQMQKNIGSATDPEEIKQQLNDVLQNLMQANRSQE